VTRGARDTHARRRVQRRRRSTLVLFRLALFKSVKHNFLGYNLKFSKNKSCRETMGLQILQRVTYVLVICLIGKTW
jgi:hypothetical protein